MSDQPRKQQIGSAKTYIPIVQPDEIAGLEGWYRSDVDTLFSDAGTTEITEGGDVDQWNDKSGNGRHLLATDLNRRPLYNAATGANSYPGLTFDGLNHSLKTAALAASITAPQHIFIVFEPLAWSNARYIYSSQNASQVALLQYPTATPNITMKGTAVGNTGEAAIGSDHLVEAFYTSSTNSSITVDDAATVTGDDIGVADYDGIRVGGSSDSGGFSNIIVTEVMIYSAEITGTDLTNLRAYITGRYGIATN